MTTTTTSSGINCQASPRQHAFSRMGKQAVSALKYVRVWVRSPWLHVRPRVALPTGSVFVLLTLCLPTVVGSWGDSRPGTDLASGAEDTWWPGGLTGFAANGRRFYLFCLALAAFTMPFLFASALHWNLTRRHGLLTWVGAISGSAALVSVTDLFMLASILQFDRWFSVNGDLTLLALVVLLGLLLVACFRPEFWTKKGAIFWAFDLGQHRFFLMAWRPFAGQVLPTS